MELTLQLLENLLKNNKNITEITPEILKEQWFSIKK